MYYVIIHPRLLEFGKSLSRVDDYVISHENNPSHVLNRVWSIAISLGRPLRDEVQRKAVKNHFVISHRSSPPLSSVYIIIRTHLITNEIPISVAQKFCVLAVTCEKRTFFRVSFVTEFHEISGAAFEKRQIIWLNSCSSSSLCDVSRRKETSCTWMIYSQNWEVCKTLWSSKSRSILLRGQSVSEQLFNLCFLSWKVDDLINVRPVLIKESTRWHSLMWGRPGCCRLSSARQAPR